MPFSMVGNTRVVFWVEVLVPTHLALNWFAAGLIYPIRTIKSFWVEQLVWLDKIITLMSSVNNTRIYVSFFFFYLFFVIVTKYYCDSIFVLIFFCLWVLTTFSSYFFPSYRMYTTKPPIGIDYSIVCVR